MRPEHRRRFFQTWWKSSLQVDSGHYLRLHLYIQWRFATCLAKGSYTAVITARATKRVTIEHLGVPSQAYFIYPQPWPFSTSTYRGWRSIWGGRSLELNCNFLVKRDANSICHQLPSCGRDQVLGMLKSTLTSCQIEIGYVYGAKSARGHTYR